MTLNTSHIADEGAVLELTVKDQNGNVVSLVSATVTEFWFKKPGRVFDKVDAEFTTDGSDGLLRYIFIADDLLYPGLWYVQAYVELPSSKLHSSYFEFMVEPNLE